jgi:hypothetical protein
MRRRRRRRGRRFARPPAVLALVIVVAGMAVTATSTIPQSRADDQARPVNVNELKPPACSGLVLTTLVTGAGAIDDSGGRASLILGSIGADSINARNRDDCLVAGAGNDALNGGQGDDVCIGGPGVDTFANCETTIP